MPTGSSLHRPWLCVTPDPGSQACSDTAYVLNGISFNQFLGNQNGPNPCQFVGTNLKCAGLNLDVQLSDCIPKSICSAPSAALHQARQAQLFQPSWRCLQHIGRKCRLSHGWAYIHLEHLSKKDSFTVRTYQKMFLSTVSLSWSIYVNVDISDVAPKKHQPSFRASTCA